MMHDRIPSPFTYGVVTLVLLVLTGLNIALGYVDLRGLNGVLALAIAAVEALIMVLVFMHLRWSPAMTRVAGVAALFWLAILISGVLDDMLTRAWIPVPGK